MKFSSFGLAPMRSSDFLLLFGYAARLIAAAEPPRPRGVGPECPLAQPQTPCVRCTNQLTVAKYFKSSESFQCISRPSMQFAPSQVNDDFCDCPDGSDEPGTAACAHLSPLSPPSLGNAPFEDPNTTLALPGFYCKNKGHIPAYVPFMSVNDGVCDYEACCDGSDEWAKVGGTKCEDRCKEIGKAWREQDEQRKRSLTAASRRRKELVGEAEKLAKQVADRIETLQTQIQGDEIKIKGLESNVADLERQERGKVIKQPAQPGKLGVLAQLAKERIEELRGSLLDVRTQRDISKERLLELEGILSTFKEEYNPNFNDEGVKRAVRSWEDYAARDKPQIGNEAQDRDLDEIAKTDAESGVINWAEWEKNEEEAVDVREYFDQIGVPSRKDLSYDS